MCLQVANSLKFLISNTLTETNFTPPLHPLIEEKRHGLRSPRTK